jgi:hypothetical protein
MHFSWLSRFSTQCVENYPGPITAILKCFGLIDLKVGTLTHQDLGQMQMYVNYYTFKMMNEGDSRPLGIILCADKNEAVVCYTLLGRQRSYIRLPLQAILAE